MKQMVAAAAVILFSVSAWAYDAHDIKADKPPVPETPAKPFVYAHKPADVVIGNANSPVTIVEYASLSCPHCAHFFNDVLPQLTEKYVKTGKVRFIYRHYPLNEPALKGAALVNCADKDRRHDFLKVLFKMQNKWAYGISATDSLANIAALGGMERARFDKCMADKDMEKSILEVEKEATDDYKLNVTPTFFINGSKYTGKGTLEALSAEIDNALAAKAKK